MTRVGANIAARQADERNKGAIFKNCAPSLIVKIKWIKQLLQRWT